MDGWVVDGWMGGWKYIVNVNRWSLIQGLSHPLPRSPNLSHTSFCLFHLVLIILCYQPKSSFCFCVVREYMQGGVCTSTARLDGKVVLVTGANTGIGKETVRDMVSRGKPKNCFYCQFKHILFRYKVHRKGMGAGPKACVTLTSPNYWYSTL